MTWQDRLVPEITLVSPSGQEFKAHWSGNSRSVSKKLGIFEYPKLAGAIVQDLDVGGVRYPLTFHFEGPDNDLDADLFFIACSERGAWTVRHPVRGWMTLQLISVTEDMQPVTSGNITTIESEWIETSDALQAVSVPELAELVITMTGDIQIKKPEQFVQQGTKGYTLVEMKNSVLSSVNQVMKDLAAVNQLSAEINAQILSVHRTITTTINSTGMNLLSLAGSLQTLVTLPADALTSIQTTFDYYAGILADPGTDNPVVGELMSVSALVVMMQSVASGELSTREEALNLIDTLSNGFMQMVYRLDAQNPEALLDTYNELAVAVTTTTNLMLRRSYDLLTAKRITLRTHRAPVEIAITEGIDLDYLIASNMLKGTDILLLPAGREVVIYK